MLHTHLLWCELLILQYNIYEYHKNSKYLDSYVYAKV